MTNVIEKLKRNVLKITLIATALSSGHAIAESGVFFIDERANYNFCELASSTFQSKLIGEEHVFCTDIMERDMDVYIPIDETALKGGQVGDIYKVTFDMDDLVGVERVDEYELLKSNNEKENVK